MCGIVNAQCAQYYYWICEKSRNGGQLYLLAALVISVVQAHADEKPTGSLTISGWNRGGGPANCIPLGSPLSGESVPCGGINTTQQVLDAKQLIDDMAEKQKVIAVLQSQIDDDKAKLSAMGIKQ